MVGLTLEVPGGIEGLVTDKDGKTLDSSEILRAGHSRLLVKEVALMRPGATFGKLDEAIDYARERGYFVAEPVVVNVSHGEPGKNEPKAVINLVERASHPRSVLYLADAIIAQDFDHDHGSNWCFYVHGEGFRYMA